MTGIVEHQYGIYLYGIGPYGGTPIIEPPVILEGAGLFRDRGQGDLSTVPDMWHHEELDEEKFEVREFNG